MIKRKEQAKLAFPVTHGELLKQNLSVKFRRTQQRATALVMRGITRAQHKGGKPRERGVGDTKRLNTREGTRFIDYN